MKIRGKSFTSIQKKILSKRNLGSDFISKYLFKATIVLPADEDVEHLNPNCDKVEYWDIISRETGEISRIKIREL